MGRRHSSYGIEGQMLGLGFTLGLGLGSQFERRSVGPRSLIEDRFLLRQRIVDVHCLLVTHASNYVSYSCNSGKIFKLHVSCARPFIEKFLTVNVCCIAFVYCVSDCLYSSLS